MNGVERDKSTVFTVTACGALVLSFVLCAGSPGSAGADNEGYAKSVAYTSESLRDPFEGYIQKEQVPIPVSRLMEEENFVPPPVEVAGITWGSSFPQAIINGKVAKEGDMVGEVKVISISKEGLVLSYNNQHFSLPAPGRSKAQGSGQNTP